MMSDDQSTKEKSPKLPALKSSEKGLSRKSKDLLSHYLAEVRKYPLLSREEEKEYAISYQETGDRQAAEKLVTSNLRLVIKIAFQYHRQWANVLDLIQEGNVGLVEALSRYDPYRDIRFSSYAQYWIRAMILRFLLDNFRLVRLGSTRAGRKLFFQLQKERDRLRAEGIDPSHANIASRLGVSEKEVDAVDQHMRAPALSFDAPIGDNEGRALSEIVPQKDGISPEVDAAKNQLGLLVKEKLAEFAAGITDEREMTIWKERMVAIDPVSLSALGKRYNVSKERIRQVEARIKKRLREYFEATLGDEIDFEFSIPEDEA
jgi:RNA polymerase sigma-32 factor